MPRIKLIFLLIICTIRYVFSTKVTKITKVTNRSLGMPKLAYCGNINGDRKYYIQTCDFAKKRRRKNENPSLHVKKKKNIYIKIYGRDHRNPYLAYEHINRIIENKKYEVTKLLEENADENSPLQIRLKYLQHTMNNKLSESLKIIHSDEKHRLSMVADIKRKVFCSTNKADENYDLKKNINNYEIENERKKNENMINNSKNEKYVYQNNFLNLTNPGEASLMLHKIGFDVLIVNIDSLSAQGTLNDLSDVIKSTRTLTRNSRPAVVVDDVIIHPIQIALAVENKADGVILNLSYLKNDLEDMLNYCVNLGTQAIVEVHDYNDIYYATQCGSYILMINEFDFINNRYEYNHAIKAISYSIPELITIAKINVSDINYVEKLGSLGYDSICLEKKLIDEDLEVFVQSCKNWKAPHKTLLYLNRNNYLKNFLTYKNNSPGENYKDTTKNLEKMYDDKNLENKYSEQMLKDYEKEFINVEDSKKNEEVVRKNETAKISQINQKSENVSQDNSSLLTNDEKKIINNFKQERKNEIMLLNQMKDIIKEVDNQCKNYEHFSEEESIKKEEKLESLLENFTKLDKSFLKQFFSDEEINNIENSIKNAVHQKKKIQDGEINIENTNFTGFPSNQMNDFDINRLTKEFFDTNGSGNNHKIDNKLLDDYSDDSSSRGLSSQ
ncbi:conserved Plasmodium protein, unknown function [Plasmodium berghei]|uniref:indole-3-glycerol-phosphate synthase n=2 Tax=Plasmodium berghei TaxID=5821 RepID=A0A509AL65_PLABA|nr:IGPS-like protein, putative [Plasmodium berghei ANKA]CXI68636.1 conserved Plasmodium protein, unknown function [Plasmodium berghei]SCM24204.1 conserved Plasmodium protein, unknown function [Plasmodium berghei]SCN26987.1 conserved Plasmodium protein, unknown function [Plasmodium berghei]SCO61431.1 conserved Plasmodium protein, unknown function [Plasmodium berghei]SCO63408.1 conserved Plasmodium protein, unknown function [Plasmodium berghei]|eukprot:XP_034422603.1 IGPS-like protein, putative [Plasmodium berghei ANKA]